MVNHSQSEEHKKILYDQLDDDGDVKQVAHVTNFKKYLKDFGFSKKIYFHIATHKRLKKIINENTSVI